LEETFDAYKDMVKFLEWLKSVKGQVFFVSWDKKTIRYNRPFIKELDEVKGTFYYYSATEGLFDSDEKPWRK
jgi:hypothetical protein